MKTLKEQLEELGLLNRLSSPKEIRKSRHRTLLKRRHDLIRKFTREWQNQHAQFNKRYDLNELPKIPRKRKPRKKPLRRVSEKSIQKRAAKALRSVWPSTFSETIPLSGGAIEQNRKKH